MEKLSLLIPIYNEEDNIQNLLDVLVHINWQLQCEIVIVDDCSKDKSLELTKQWIDNFSKSINQRSFEFKVSFQPANSGKGAAIRKAIELATGTICIVQDADLEYDPSEITKLIEPIIMNKADVVYGSRFKKNAVQVHRTFHYFVNRFLTILSNLFSGMYLSDMETCYKAVRSDILKNLNLSSPRFGFEVEITSHLARLCVRIQELPISYFPRNYLQGKKISWKDGVAAVFHILKFNCLTAEKKRFKKTMPSKYTRANSWL